MNKRIVIGLTFFSLLALAGWATAIVFVMQNIQKETELDTWIKLAAKSQAVANYQRGDLHFMCLESISPVKTNFSKIQSTKSGFQVKYFPNRGDSDRKFVDIFNQQMEQLLTTNSAINRNSDTNRRRE